MNRTAIDYVDYTWNPYTGCLHGCTYCYARRITRRLGGPEPEDKTPREGKGAFPYGFAPTFYPSRLGEPKKVKAPSRIFVADMGDLFGHWVPREWIERILDVVRECPWHTFLFLTKNPKRYREFAFPDNAWIGTTAEDQNALEERALLLEEVEVQRRWFSIEPLLGYIDLSVDLENGEYYCPECGAIGNHTEHIRENDFAFFECNRCGYTNDNYEQWGEKAPIDWVVVEQQTGPNAVSPAREWVESLIEQCREAHVPIWIKRPLYNEFPIQELPAKGEER